MYSHSSCLTCCVALKQNCVITIKSQNDLQQQIPIPQSGGIQFLQIKFCNNANSTVLSQFECHNEEKLFSWACF